MTTAKPSYPILELRVALTVSDYQRALQFYCDGLGIEPSGQIRFALQVPNLKMAMERLLAHGATLVHPPVLTPWGDQNVRLQDPDGMQITLFQKPDHPKQDE